MMNRKVYAHAFAGGEIAPLMLGHIEDEGYRTGFASSRNMICMPTGAVTKRPQLDFVRAAYPGATTVRLFPFVYGDGDAYAMEWTPNRIRFHAEGQTLLYATPIPVASVDLATDTFTTIEPHGLTIGVAVRITHKGTSIPGNLATGTTYYVNTAPTTRTFTLSASSGPLVLLDLTTNSTIDGTSFWRQSELPREYITSKNVTRTGVQLDTSFAHTLVDGDKIYFSTTGALPSNSLDASPALTVGQLYYAKVIDSDSIEVATTRQAALAVAFLFSATLNSTTLTAVGHGLVDGSSVRLSSTILLPSPLSGNVNYYVVASTANTLGLALTPGGAAITCTSVGSGFHTANPRLTLNSSGSGTNTMHYAYYKGDVVWAGSLTLLAGTSSRCFVYSVDGFSTALPTVADWMQMSADGSYEVYTTLGAAELADLNYDQSLDVWTAALPQKAAFTLSREVAAFPSGTSATADVVKWVLRNVSPAPGPSAPTLSLSSQVFGEYYEVTIPVPAPSFWLNANGGTNHGLIAGDVVYGEASIGSGTASAGLPGSPGFFIVTVVSANQLQLRTVVGGTEAGNSSGSTQYASLRRVNSASRNSETYVVTALRDGEESASSAALVVVNNLDVEGSSNTLTWTASTGAQRYRLYRYINGDYGLIVETDTLSATDDGISPDLSIRPPRFDNDLYTQFPRAAARFQQRAWFGGTDANARIVWGGTTGTVSTMSYHQPTPLDTDRIRFEVAARDRTQVRHIVPASQLWILTSSAEIRITGQNTDVISPVAGIDARPLSQIGCTKVRPIVANSNILFVGARNGHVYEMPSQALQIVDPSDLSIRAAHLFDDYTLTQSAQQMAQVPIEWFARSDGALLGMTYMPDQNIRGWHVHTAGGTNAAIESVCVIPDSDGQRLYAVVARTISSATVRHIERMGRIAQPSSLTACRYLDSCITYSGPPTTSIKVPHLPGEGVYAVADGVLRGPFTVSSGTITLGTAASTVHVGLLYAASLRTLPPVMLVDGFGKGTQMAAKEATLRVDKSCAFDVAVYSDDGYPRRAWPASGITNTALASKDVPVPIEGSFGRNAQVEISQSSPFPLTIVSMALEVSVGGP